MFPHTAAGCTEYDLDYWYVAVHNDDFGNADDPDEIYGYFPTEEAADQYAEFLGPKIEIKLDSYKGKAKTIHINGFVINPD